MKYWVPLLFVLGGALAQRFQPQPSPGRVIAILRQSSDLNPDGSYQWSYETENGISAEETGQVKNANGPEPILEAQGGFRFTAPDGTPVDIRYVANENGFQPAGNVIPQPPPIPDAILRSLAYNEAHPEQDDSRSGGGFRRP